MKKVLLLLCMIMQNVCGADGLPISIKDATFFKIHYPEYSVIHKSPAFVTMNKQDDSRNDPFVQYFLQADTSCVSFHNRSGSIVHVAHSLHMQDKALLRKRLDPNARLQPVGFVVADKNVFAFLKIFSGHNVPLEEEKRPLLIAYDEKNECVAEVPLQNPEASFEEIKQLLQSFSLDVSRLKDDGLEASALVRQGLSSEGSDDDIEEDSGEDEGYNGEDKDERSCSCLKFFRHPWWLLFS